ncbi:hypothetical protein DVH24_039192 [Malus domestica]|uniref:Uncharacterized protein n=1 Tax=Malus domestica TaxID=3750 RepID=A0A498KBL8_MALDO|nr:hypothetical protein DVH24_039192 [Malus domestica]
MATELLDNGFVALFILVDIRWCVALFILVNIRWCVALLLYLFLSRNGYCVLYNYNYSLLNCIMVGR